ncbi:YafY family protein [Brevundimonas sp. M20]|uniref:helix-turn-helix transcriptional regulator n=1 Tax=Brevundimonas sp. M20 TaxID=2591463 RepID=UPI00197AA760|nr:WYL domain-containing protein [Brevundimonas sp. M20]
MGSIVQLVTREVGMSFHKATELVRLALMAASRRGVSLKDIEQEFGCHRRTAQRMTKALEDCFPAVEVRVDDDRTLRWVLPSRPVAPLLTPSADELVSIKAGIDELKRCGMGAEAVHLRTLDYKVRSLIPPGVSVRLEADEEALLEALGHATRPGPRLATRAPIDAALSQALKGPFQLKMLYRSRSEAAPRERIVAPHGLLLGVRRYLVARDLSKPGSNLRHYRVEDIEAAEVLPDSFALDTDFSLRVHSERAFGSYESDGEHGPVVWRFTPEAARRARRYEFHPTQVFEDQPDGSLIVRFEASGHLEMCWHLYTWGDKVEVLEPESLRFMVKDHRRPDFPSMP